MSMHIFFLVLVLAKRKKNVDEFKNSKTVDNDNNFQDDI